MINLNEYELGKSEKKIFYVALGLLGIIVSMLLYRNILFAVVVIPFSKKIYNFVVDEIISRRRQNYLIQFKDFLFMTSTAIGAGRSMKDAIHESIPALKEIYGDGSILPTELEKTYERMEVGGEKDTDVLMDLAIKSGLEDVLDFATIYSICKTTGASVIIALNRAANVIIEKMTIEREISELVKRKETEGLAIFAMPIIVVLFLNIFAPDYISPLYETLAGRALMTIVFVVNIAIFKMIKKITSVEI